MLEVMEEKRSDKRRNVSKKVHAAVQCLQSQGLLFSLSTLLAQANINETYQLCHSVGSFIPFTFIKTFLKRYFSCIWEKKKKKRKKTPLVSSPNKRNCMRGNEKLHRWTWEFERLLGKHPICLTKICSATVYCERAVSERGKFTMIFLITLSCLQIFPKCKQKDLFFFN